MAEVVPIRRKGKPTGLGFDFNSGQEVQPESSLIGQEGFDPFAFEDSGYAVTKFYTRASDEHGRSDKISVKIPVGLDGQIRQICAQIPYYQKNPHAFFRDAAIHRLHQIYRLVEDEDGDLARALRLAERASVVSQLQEESDTLENIISGYTTTFQSLIERKDWDLIQRTLDECAIDADEAREPYARRLRELRSVYAKKMQMEKD